MRLTLGRLTLVRLTLVRLMLICTSAGSCVAIFQPSLTLTDSCVAIHMIALAHAAGVVVRAYERD